MKTAKFSWAIIIVLILLVSACGPTKAQYDAQQTQIAQQEQILEALVTKVFESTPTAVSTATPNMETAIAATVEARLSMVTTPVSMTQTVQPTATVTEGSPVFENSILDSVQESGWGISFYKGSTDQMEGWFRELKDPQPEVWPDFPNVDNPVTDFVAANGLEYGLDESIFMEQNEMGNFPVQARGYRLISGDYDLPGYDKCDVESAEAGCAIAIFNVGEVTADIEGWVRQGFTVPGRYWNGDELDQAMWGLSSHVSANMLNLNTNGAGGDTLNQDSRTNAGANCSVPSGCEKVRFTIIITSGNQMLVKAVTFVMRP